MSGADPSALDEYEKDFHIACDEAVRCARDGAGAKAQRLLSEAKERLADMELEARVAKEFAPRVTFAREKYGSVVQQVKALVDGGSRAELLGGAGASSGGAAAAASRVTSADGRARMDAASATMKSGADSLVASSRRIDEATAMAEGILGDLAEQRGKLASIRAKVAEVDAGAEEANSITKRMSSWFGW